MSHTEIFWGLFEKFGSIDAYIGYASSKKSIIEENTNESYEYF